MALTDSISVFAEGTYEEQMQELVDYLTRGRSEFERAVFVEQYQNLLKGIGDKLEEDKDITHHRRVFSFILSEIKSLGEGSEREIEGFFNLVYSHLLTLYTAGSPELSRNIILLARVVTTSSSENLHVRYRLLVNLFNALVRNSSDRCLVCRQLLQMVSDDSQLEILMLSPSEIDKWTNEWAATSEEKSGFLKLIANAYMKAGKLELAYHYTLTYARSLPQSSAESETASLDAVAMALRLPSVFEFDNVLKIEEMNNLNGQPLYVLLKILIEQDLGKYKSWESMNEGVLHRYEISKTQLERKMRLLILSSLAYQNIGHDLSYSKIASALQIDQSQVERWLIDVMRTGLLSGKLSQTMQSVHVIRSTSCRFGLGQWSVLEQRLVIWQGGLSKVLDVVTSAQHGGFMTGSVADGSSVERPLWSTQAQAA